MSGPLEGLRIIDLSRGSAGALATMLLSDNGAEIIKVEPTDGDPYRFYPPLVVWNRGKRSIGLAINKPSGKKVLLNLLEGSDVLLESFRPGVTSTLGIDYPSLKLKFPKLIYCSLTGYGQTGSESGRPGYDSLVQAQVGLQWLQEGHRDGPIHLGFAAPSYSGGFTASYGILAALHARAKTGLGQHVDASLRRGAIMMQRWGWGEPVPEVAEPPRLGMTRVFQCGDGEYLWTHTGARGSFERLMGVLGLIEFVEGNSRTRMDTVTTKEVVVELNQRAEEIFASKSRSEWQDLLDAADVPNRPLLYPGEAFADIQVNFIEAITTVDDPNLGPLREVAPPYRFELTPHGTPSSAPLAGEHTLLILKELGYSSDEIQELKRDSVIRADSG